MNSIQLAIITIKISKTQRSTIQKVKGKLKKTYFVYSLILFLYVDCFRLTVLIKVLKLALCLSPSNQQAKKPPIIKVGVSQKI